MSKNFCTRAELLNLFKTNASLGMHKRKGFDRVPGLDYNGEITCELMLFSGSGPLAFSFSFTLNGKLRCQLRHLQKFWAMVPNKKLFDLSANVDKRKRTEAQHSVLPCLTTSSQLWFLVW